MTTGKRITYELLLKKNSHIGEQHYYSSEVQIMEPDTYGGVVNSSPLAPPSLNSERYYPHKKSREDNQDERIEVKILPQDENWGETTTTTCNLGNDDILTLNNNNEKTLQLNQSIEYLSHKINHRIRSILISHFLTYLLCFLAYLSPILFLILPYLLNRSEIILINDYTLILTIICKIFLLLISSILLFYRRRNTIYMPRINFQRILFLIILFNIILSYWIFYILKFLQTNIINYDYILSMTSTYEDLLLFLLFIVFLTLEIKCLYPKWIIKIVRSPDGQTKQYTIGSMSIQEASIYILEQYYKDFPVFNPWLEGIQQKQLTKSICSTSTREYNDRFYDELDYERRVRKRRTKLLTSCEDAFTNVRKYLYDKSPSHIPMDAREAAQAVFSSMSRSLQKYLRITRQQPYFTRDSIISHLSICLSHDLSPRTFLERYIQPESQPLATLLFPKITEHIEQSWTILCNTQNKDDNNQKILINQSIYSNLVIVLKQKHAEHIGLICTFYQIPRIHLIEKFFSTKNNKFLLKINSETSV